MLPDSDEITDPFLAAKAIIEAFPANPKWQVHESNFDDFMALLEDAIAGKVEFAELADPKYQAYHYVFLEHLGSGTEPSEIDLREGKQIIEAMRKSDPDQMRSKISFVTTAEFPLQVKAEILPLAIIIAQRAFNLAVESERDDTFRIGDNGEGFEFAAANRYPDCRKEAIEKLEAVRQEMAGMFQPLERGKGYEFAVPPIPTRSSYVDLDAACHAAFGLEDLDLEQFQQNRDRKGKIVHWPDEEDVDAEAALQDKLDKGEVTTYYRISAPKDIAWVEKHFLKKARGKEMQL